METLNQANASLQKIHILILLIRLLLTLKKIVGSVKSIECEADVNKQKILFNN